MEIIIIFLKNMFKLKKVFVTGCAGFVGSNLTKRLLDRGYFVTGVDNLSTGKLKYLDELILSLIHI